MYFKYKVVTQARHSSVHSCARFSLSLSLWRLQEPVKLACAAVKVQGGVQAVV